MHHPSLAELVAASLRERVVGGEMRDGDELPKLEDLVDEFGVSKPTLREALRILESEGIVTVRRGKFGGAVVHVPRAQNAAYTLGLVLRADGVTIGDVGVALQRLEPACAALCAERDDRATTVLPRLEAAHARAVEALDEDGEVFIQRAGQFHAELVATCGNATMMLVAGALESIWLANAHVRARAADSRPLTTAERRQAITVHAKILEQIARGDAEAVYRLTYRHVAGAQSLPLGSLDRRIEVLDPHRSASTDTPPVRSQL
jgi:DNA-binding FadR family transcriptional regulator